MAASSLTPFESAVCAWIIRLPGTWTQIDWDKLTLTHEQAMRRLVAGGFVQARVPLTFYPTGQVPPLRLLWRVTGNYPPVLEQQVADYVASRGFDVTKGRIEVGQFTEARLTSDGELAKRDFTGDHPFQDPNHLHRGLPVDLLRVVTGGHDGSGGVKPVGQVSLETSDSAAPERPGREWFTLDVMGGQAATTLEDRPEHRQAIAQLRSRLRAVASKREKSLLTVDDPALVRAVKAWLIGDMRMPAEAVAQLPVSEAADLLERVAKMDQKPSGLRGDDPPDPSFTSKEAAFLLAAYRESPNDPFDCAALANTLHFSQQETRDVSMFLATKGLLSLFSTGAMLTVEGRREASKLLDRQQMNRYQAVPKSNARSFPQAEITERQQRFLLAAFAAAPEPFVGSERAVFNYRAVGASIGFSDVESDDIADVLSALGYLQNWQQPDVGILTAKGRERARELKAESPPSVSISGSEAGFLIAAAEIADSEGQFLSEVAAKRAGIRNREVVRDRLIDLGLMQPGRTFAEDLLTHMGFDAVGQIKEQQHKKA